MKNEANGFMPTTEEEREHIEAGIHGLFEGILEVLRIDTEGDPNTQETAKRWAKMMVQEVCWGRFQPKPKITTFPNTKDLDEIITTGPITVRSMCSHHFVPIIGEAWIGIIPGEHLMGLSKYNRITNWVMARPQIQEEATVQLADELEGLIKPKGLAVVVKASHMCLSWRGVQDAPTSFTTSIVRGLFMEREKAKHEFFQLIKAQGFTS